MIYNLNLQMVGLVVGLLLLAAHAFALVKPALSREALGKFPRHRGVGIGILTVDLLWAVWLIQTVDFGEFNKYKTMMMIVVPALYVGCIYYLDEFLAVRALGVLLLLAAQPVLDAAFLHEETSRLLLTFLAYVWIVAGLFYVGMPFFLRDQISWVSSKPIRWKAAAGAGAAYGALVLLSAILFYG